MNKWPLQSECLRLFGNPTTSKFNKNLTTIRPPYKMHMGDIPITRITVNKICAESLLRILNQLNDHYNGDVAALTAAGVNKFSGAWAVRNMRGGSQMSMHAYGLAIDFDAERNPLGIKPGRRKGSFTDDSPIVKMFKAEGWVWGGDWQSRPDGMHFQAAIVG
jgi:hypothetical protein